MSNLKNIPKTKRGNPAWTKGVSGNPKGRKPKADCLLSCIKSELDSKSINGKQTKEQVIAAALVEMAERGNLKAIELLMSYTIVKPTQQLDLTTKGEAINGKRAIPVSVIDEAMEILYQSGASPTLSGDSLPTPA